jgi:hypothetical protein
MTDKVEERSYRWQRRYVFATSCVIILMLLILSFIV